MGLPFRIGVEQVSIKGPELEKPPIECLLGKVLVLRDNFEETSKIITPEESQEPPWTGRVVSFGPGRTLQSGKFDPVSDLRAGQRIAFKSYSGYEVPLEQTIDGTKKIVKHQMISFDDVIAEVDDTAVFQNIF